MELVIRGLVGPIALMMLALGTIPMFAPRKAVDKHFIEPVGIAGLNTIRSMIGGTFLASFVMLVIGLATGQTIWYLAVAVFMGVVAVGRVISILIDGYQKALFVPLVAEVLIVVVLVVAAVQPGAT